MRNGFSRGVVGLNNTIGISPTDIDRLYDFTQLGRSAKTPPTASGITPLNQTASAPWYSSPAVAGDYTPTENFSWNNVPTSGFSNRGPSPTKRGSLQDRRSAAPDGSAPMPAQGALPATRASEAGVAGSGGVLGVLGKFFRDSLITPAEAASPSAQEAPPLAPYFPGQEAAFRDPLGNPDSYPKLRRVSSAFPSMTPPLPLGGLLNNSNLSGNDDWFKGLAGLVLQNSAWPDPPQQTAGSMPERRLGRRTYSLSPPSVFDTGAPAVPFVSSDDAHYPGGLPGRFAALTGLDPQNPDQLASLPLGDDEEQPDLRALEAAFSGSGNIRDAVALHNARRSSWR